MDSVKKSNMKYVKKIKPTPSPATPPKMSSPELRPWEPVFRTEEPVSEPVPEPILYSCKPLKLVRQKKIVQEAPCGFKLCSACNKLVEETSRFRTCDKCRADSKLTYQRRKAREELARQAGERISQGLPANEIVSE